MVDTVLLFGRLVLIALLYLFLLAAVRTGLSVVRGERVAPRRRIALSVVAGPPELAGVTLPLDAPVTIGRAPEVDLVVSDDFVSSTHARLTPAGDGALLEDLGSTNGTLLNGRRVSARTPVSPGDVVQVGTVKLKVVRS